MKLAPALLKTDVSVPTAFGSFGDVIFAENHVLQYLYNQGNERNACAIFSRRVFSILFENQLDNKCVKRLEHRDRTVKILFT